MAYVTPREGETPESLVNRFRASVQHAGILRELKDRRFFPVQGPEGAAGSPAGGTPASPAAPVGKKQGRHQACPFFLSPDKVGWAGKTRLIYNAIRISSSENTSSPS